MTITRAARHARCDALQADRMTLAGGNVQGSDRAAKGTARASAAVLLRSRVPGTAGNRREQPSASPSIYAGFPACSRLCSEYERIGETASFQPQEQ
jgi:hypothetical protein